MLYWHYMLKGQEMPANALDSTLGGNRSGPKRVIARTWYEGNLVPGYVKQETGVGYFAFENDVVITRDEYEVLVATDWMSIASCKNYSPDVQLFPQFALAGGSSFHCATYHIGCVTVGGDNLCGFIKNRKCYVAVDSEVVESNNFSILIDLTNEEICSDDAAMAMDDEWDKLSDHESEDNGIPKITDVRTISESEAVQAVTSVETNRPKRDNEKTGRIGLVDLNTLLEKKKTANVENMSELDREEYLATMSDDELAEYLAEGGKL